MKNILHFPLTDFFQRNIIEQSIDGVRHAY